MEQIKKAATKGYDNFEAYALNRFEKNYGQFYSSFDEFKEHFYSGDVKTPFPDMVSIVQDYIKQLPPTSNPGDDTVLTPEIRKHLENIHQVEGIFFTFCSMNGVGNLSMCTDGTDIWFEEVGNEKNHTTHVSREALEKLPILELTEMVTTMLSYLVETNQMRDKHHIGKMVRFFLPRDVHEVADITAWVKAIHTFVGKKKYDLEIITKTGKTRIYNVDAEYVKDWGENLDTDNSVVDFLRSKEMANSFEARKQWWNTCFPDASYYWEYKGTEQQNIMLLRKLKDIC